MATSTWQGELFPAEDASGRAERTVVVNGRCSIRTRAGYRVVTVRDAPVAHYAVGDRMAEAYAMVILAEQHEAKQTEIAAAFDCDPRTVRRYQRRFEAGGLAALGRGSGYPKGSARLAPSCCQLVNDWKAEGTSNREIARRLAVSETAVRKLLRRLGWKPDTGRQLTFDLEPAPANPNLSGSRSGPASTESEHTRPGSQGSAADVDSGLCGTDTCTTEPPAVSFDTDPMDRSFDRVMARLGLLDDAAPLFAPAPQVPGAGVLLAVPALVDSGVFRIATEICGSIRPAFYGLRTSLVTLLLMALLRIKRPEGLKEHSPRVLGRLLGLDRAPEVKTLRRKLARLAAFGRAADFGRALAEHRVATRGHAMGFLYVDGHVRAYHGKHPLPKTHLTRIRLAMPATTDYWVNDAAGEPLFVVTTEANRGLVKVLPGILDEVRTLVGDRRVTVIFDRGGWSPKLFKELIGKGFDIMTYRKGRCRRVRSSCFSAYEAVLDGREVRYVLADTGTHLEYGPRHARKRLHLRQVTRLAEDGHQTPIITSRRELRAIEVAYRNSREGPMSSE